MDPSLIKEMNAFKKQAMARILPPPPIGKKYMTALTAKLQKKVEEKLLVNKRKDMDSDGMDVSARTTIVAPAPVRRKEPAPAPLSFIRAAQAESKSMGDGGKYKLQLLTKLVRLLKEKFLCSSKEPRSIDQLLTELGETAVPVDTKSFLVNSALPSNIRVTVTKDQKYIYKPPLVCCDKATLLSCIKMCHDDVGGGLLLDDIVDSLGCGYSYVKALAEDKAVTIVTRADNKEVIFYNDGHLSFDVVEPFKELYHSVNVTAVDIRNIEAYLRLNGMKPLMEGRGKFQKANIESKPSRVVKKYRTVKEPRDNAHVADQLKNYGEGFECEPPGSSRLLNTSTKNTFSNPIRVPNKTPQKLKRIVKKKGKPIVN